VVFAAIAVHKGAERLLCHLYNCFTECSISSASIIIHLRFDVVQPPHPSPFLVP
jgi:hypothetical protein